MTTPESPDEPQSIPPLPLEVGQDAFAAPPEPLNVDEGQLAVDAAEHGVLERLTEKVAARATPGLTDRLTNIGSDRRYLGFKTGDAQTDNTTGVTMLERTPAVRRLRTPSERLDGQIISLQHRIDKLERLLPESGREGTVQGNERVLTAAEVQRRDEIQARLRPLKLAAMRLQSERFDRYKVGKNPLMTIDEIYTKRYDDLVGRYKKKHGGTSPTKEQLWDMFDRQAHLTSEQRRQIEEYEKEHDGTSPTKEQLWDMFGRQIVLPDRELLEHFGSYPSVKVWRYARIGIRKDITDFYEPQGRTIPARRDSNPNKYAKGLRDKVVKKLRGEQGGEAAPTKPKNWKRTPPEHYPLPAEAPESVRKADLNAALRVASKAQSLTVESLAASLGIHNDEAAGLIRSMQQQGIVSAEYTDFNPETYKHEAGTFAIGYAVDQDKLRALARERKQVGTTENKPQTDEEKFIAWYANNDRIANIDSSIKTTMDAFVASLPKQETLSIREQFEQEQTKNARQAEIRRTIVHDRLVADFEGEENIPEGLEDVIMTKLTRHAENIGRKQGGPRKGKPNHGRPRP